MISGMWGFALFVFLWDDQDEDEDTILHNQNKKSYFGCSHSLKFFLNKVVTKKPEEQPDLHHCQSDIFM